MTHFEIMSKDPKITDPSWQKQFRGDYHRGLLLEMPYFETYAGHLLPTKTTMAFASRRFEALKDAEFVLVCEDRRFMRGTAIVEPLKKACLGAGKSKAFMYLGKKAEMNELFKDCESQCWRFNDGRLVFLIRYVDDADEKMGRLMLKTGLDVVFCKCDLGHYYEITLEQKEEPCRETSRPATEEEEAEFEEYLKYLEEIEK